MEMKLVKVLLTSHGNLAEGILSGFEFIAGKSSKILTLQLDNDGIDKYRSSLNELLDQQKESVLILADLKGGTPYNESYKYYLEHPERVSLISGLNLPMLLELIPQLTSKTTLDEATEIVLKAGAEGIIKAVDIQDDDDDLF